MTETCCVEGCVPAKEDVTFFKFPNSRTLRRKWLDAIPSSSIKVTLSTAVCSRHFLAEQYEVVRQKRRLKAKVVPSVFDAIQPPAAEASPAREEPPAGQRGRGGRARKVAARDGREDLVRSNTNESEATRSSRPERISISDSETSHKDIEDIITNYQIKQTRPPRRADPTDVPAAGSAGPAAEGAGPAAGADVADADSRVIDVDGDEAPPVFIEVSVGKGGKVQAASGQDCMMLLESVQCEVDPSSLLLPERMDDDGKKVDSISLLTSSDSDEVIIEEPQYDLVEVSDATDEDDVPLVKLFDKPAEAEKPKERTDADLSEILWGQLCEYLCAECRHRSADRAAHRRHLRQHAPAVRVCEQCGYTTSSAQQHARHRRAHAPPRRHRCPLCAFSARRRLSLAFHMRCHAPPAPDTPARHTCSQCGYVTRRRGDMRRHQRGHAPAAPATCNLSSTAPETPNPLVTTPEMPTLLGSAPELPNPLASASVAANPLATAPETPNPLASAPETSNPLATAPETSNPLATAPETLNPLVTTPVTPNPLTCASAAHNPPETASATLNPLASATPNPCEIAPPTTAAPETAPPMTAPLAPALPAIAASSTEPSTTTTPAAVPTLAQ